MLSLCLLVRTGLAAVATVEFTRLVEAAAAPGSGVVGAAPVSGAALQAIAAADGGTDGDDNAKGQSDKRMDGMRKPVTMAPSKVAAPLAYQRLLFEQLRQLLCDSDTAAAAAAAARALPWLLQRFCAALRHHQAVAAAGVWLIASCVDRCAPQSNLRPLHAI